MIPVLTAEDVRRQDAEAEARGIPVSQLMENAGWAVARAARAMLGGAYGRRVVIVCGKGNNAGDGLVAGRVLARGGASVVAVLALGEPRGLAAEQLHAFPGRIVGVEMLDRELSRADLVIDAIFGVGLARAPEGDAARAIASLRREAAPPVLAVDIPSGVDSDTGAIAGDAVRATKTVSFTGYKAGLLFEPGASCAGQVEIADIGFAGTSAASSLERADVRALLPVRARASNKRNVGTVLVVAGSRAMPGAAALATAAAVHGGAGLTTLCSSEEVCDVVLARVPEITTIPVPTSSEGTLDLKALDLLRPRLEEFRAIAIGPGLSRHPATVDFVRALVAETTQPIVVDADGLNAFAGAAALLRERSRVVITPHAGELARIVDSTVEELESDRIATARAIAERSGVVLVFKGPGTVIAGPSTTFVNATGGASLAQGGTGDVLTGLIAAVLAQTSFDARAVAAAVWLHGRAADRIAARVWPHPANASALVDEIGPAMHEVFE